MDDESSDLTNVSQVYETTNTDVVNEALKHGWKLRSTSIQDSGSGVVDQRGHYMLIWDGEGDAWRIAPQEIERLKFARARW